MINFLRKGTHYPLIWIMILFIVLPFLAFPEITFGGQTLYWSDLSWIHYPRHIFAAEEWLAGRVPLWDPYQHNGLPFLAETQVGTLYLFSGLFLSTLAPTLELSLFILIHFTLAAIFTFILARSLGLSLAAATVSALSFGYGGFLMAQVANLNIMTGATWLPLILYGVIQATKRRTWLAAMLAGVPLAMQVFTAQPQIVFYTLVTVLGYGLYRVLIDFFSGRSPHKTNISYAAHTLLLLIVAVVTSLLLAAPQLLPTFELQQLSVRSAERGLGFLTQNSFAPALWLNLIIPNAFGNNVVGFKIGDPFQEDFIYIGFLPLLLTLFSFEQRNKRDVPFFFLLLIGGVLLAMGRYTPLYQYIIQYLPGFSLFRIPSRWLMVVNLALAILAGFGLETLRHRGVSKAKLIEVLIISLFLIIGIGLVWFFGAELHSWSHNSLANLNSKLLTAFLKHSFDTNSVYQDRLVMSKFIGLTIPAFLLLANIIIAVVLFTLYATQKVTANTFSVLVIIFLSIDLIATGGTVINPVKPASWWHQLSGGAQYVLDNVAEARVFPLGMGSEQATVTHLGQYFPSVYRVRSAGGHGSSLMLNRTNLFLKRAHPALAIQALGVRYLLTEGQMGADTAATFPIAYNDETGYVYENQTPLPRVSVVHDVIQTESAEETLNYFENGIIDPHQTVVLETKDAGLPRISSPTNVSTATTINETPQTIEIAVDAGADGYLVLLDTYYPGWIAIVDGQTTPIYRANYVSRAIFMPAGQHVAVFEYRPLSFRIGVWFALFTLATLTVIAVITLAQSWTFFSPR